VKRRTPWGLVASGKALIKVASGPCDAVEGLFEARELEPMTLKGFRRPAEAFAILGAMEEK